MKEETARKIIKSISEEKEETAGTPRPDGAKARTRYKSVFKYKPKEVSTHAFEMINDIVALSFAGYHMKAIAEKLGVDKSWPHKLKEKYPESFGICEREIIRDIIPKIGIRLTGYKHALNEMVPLAIDRIKQMLEADNLSNRDTIEVMRLLAKMVGLMDQAAVADEGQKIEKQLSPYLEKLKEAGNVVNFK